MVDPLEFDAAKDAANILKHGISLERALEIDLANAVIRPDLRAAYGEDRLLAYVRLDGRLHAMAYTWRGGVCRVISLRKANRKEVRRYG